MLLDFLALVTKFPKYSENNEIFIIIILCYNYNVQYITL